MVRPVAMVGLSNVFGGPGAVTPGAIIGPGSKTTFTDAGLPVSLQGDTIVNHGFGLHRGASINIGSADTFAVGVFAAVSGADINPIARVGDLCSCSCTIQNGDNNLFN